MTRPGDGRSVQRARSSGRSRPPAEVTVLVTHGVVVGDVTGDTLEEGETLVYRPLGNSKFRLIGRILPRAWAALRGPAP